MYNPSVMVRVTSSGGDWRGGDWRGGLKLAFANRLTRTDREVCDSFAQRIFG